MNHGCYMLHTVIDIVTLMSHSDKKYINKITRNVGHFQNCFKMLKENKLTRMNFSVQIKKKKCRLPELLMEEGKLFHTLCSKIVMVLAPDSVVAFGTCRSLIRLVVMVVFSLTLGNLRYHSGYNPNTPLYIVIHFSKVYLSLSTIVDILLWE